MLQQQNHIKNFRVKVLKLSVGKAYFNQTEFSFKNTWLFSCLSFIELPRNSLLQITLVNWHQMMAAAETGISKLMTWGYANVSQVNFTASSTDAWAIVLPQNLRDFRQISLVFFYFVKMCHHSACHQTCVKIGEFPLFPRCHFTKSYF